jgi:Caspase domain
LGFQTSQSLTCKTPLASLTTNQWLASISQNAARVATPFSGGLKLVTDVSETDLRREVRKFASDSAKADIAFVCYAGHGVQVSGENYVLPVDMAIPETEADIELTGLKVDNLVNSMRARTKIAFLDACRDNPPLFQNLVKGRRSYPKGLAPAVGSSFEQNPGEGVSGSCLVSSA